MTPLVSVLMITHNHGPFVAQAIESVLAQRLEGGLELLIGEDGSSDDSGAICAALAARHPGVIRLLRSSEGPLGMHANFARLVAAARGRYLAFLEGDDYWIEADKLAHQVALLEQDLTLALCGTRTTVIEQDADGTWTPVRELGPTHRQGRYTFAELIPHYNFHFSSVVVRRSALQLPEWVSRQYCVDRPLYLLAAQHGDAGFIDAVTSAYRQHSGGVWSGQALRYKAKSSQALFQAFQEYFPARHRPAFRRALSGILWHYLAQARATGQRDAARALLSPALWAAPLHRLRRSPREVISMALWLWAPGLDGALRRLLRSGR